MIAQLGGSKSDEDSSSDEQEEEVANLCPMANDENDDNDGNDNNEVDSSNEEDFSSFDDLKDAYDKFQTAFKELFYSHGKLLKAHKTLKKSAMDKAEQKDF